MKLMGYIIVLVVGAFSWLHLTTFEYGEIPATAPVYFAPQLVVVILLVSIILGSFITGFMLGNTTKKYENKKH